MYMSMGLGLLDATPLTALQSHLCSLHASRMAAPQAEEAVWLLSVLVSVSLTPFFYIPSIWEKTLHLLCWSVSAKFDFAQGCSHGHYISMEVLHSYILCTVFFFKSFC